MFAGVIFVVSSSSELQSPPLSTHNILAPGTTLVLSSQRFHIHGDTEKAPTRDFSWLKMHKVCFAARE